MKRGLILRFFAPVALIAVGVVLYVDLMSIHPIYMVTDAMVQRAPDAKSRQILIQSKASRDRDERWQKGIVELFLAADILLIFGVAIPAVRAAKSERRE